MLIDADVISCLLFLWREIRKDSVCSSLGGSVVAVGLWLGSVFEIHLISGVEAEMEAVLERAHLFCPSPGTRRRSIHTIGERGVWAPTYVHGR